MGSEPQEAVCIHGPLSEIPGEETRREETGSRVRGNGKSGPCEQVWTEEATPPCARKFNAPGPAVTIEYSLGN